MLWSGIGKFGTLALNFLSNLVLARLLLPSDYGAIGMLHVFIALSSVFVNAGFGSALIQKKNPTHLDYTSVFYWNLAASVIFYAALYFSGPAIARFYNMPELCKILRVQSLGLIVVAFAHVQSNQLQKQLRFRELSMRTIIATIIGTVVSITMALLGYGVWSLVFGNLVSSIASVFLLWWMSSWRPTREFSWQSLRELFNFGGLMALSSLVETLYSNLQSLIIGKWYSAKDLGYYTQARKLEGIPTTALSQIVGSVSFPVFSSLQDDKERLVSAVRRNIKAVTYLNFPLMVLLIIIARPLITLLYGAKWEPSIPFFQILCIYSMVYTLNTLNTSVIKSLGRSGVFFIVQTSKRILGIILFILGARIGIYGLLWAVVLNGYIAVLINLFVNKRLIGYGFVEQIGDVGGYYLLSVALGVAVYFACRWIPIHPYLLMLVEIVVYGGLYLLLSRWMKLEGYTTYQTIIKHRLSHEKTDSPANS